MRTLIASDLHMGSSSQADVLRLEKPRGALLDALRDVDRLVLLGDILELRHGPRRAALHAAEPFFRALSEAMGGREIVLVAGNHDHALLERWMHRRAEDPAPEPLGAQQLLAPEDASQMAVTLARWAQPARTSVAYPGLWVGDQVYAMHGHYLDCHFTVPTMERIAIAAMGRMLRRPQASLACVEDYEAVSAPVYAWIEAVAAQGATRAALNGTATVRMWRALGGQRGSARSRERTAIGIRDRLSPQRLSMRGSRALRRTAMRGGFPVAVAAINRLGLGPVQAEISGERLRRAGLQAMGEVAARLGLGQAHVIFGHTHRAGPLPADTPEEWRGRLGARLLNCGSWTYSPGFLSADPGESPYWPGGCAIVDESGPPRLMRLLAGLGHAELRGASGS